MSVPAYLLVPNGRRARGPAVLAIHGHGPGKAEVVGLDTPEVAAAASEHHGDYAHRMAEAGYVVLAPDLRCFGERADPAPADHYLCDANLVAAVAAGRNPLADNLHDLVARARPAERPPPRRRRPHRGRRVLLRRDDGAVPLGVGHPSAGDDRVRLLLVVEGGAPGAVQPLRLAGAVRDARPARARGPRRARRAARAARGVRSRRPAVPGRRGHRVDGRARGRLRRDAGADCTRSSTTCSTAVIDGTARPRSRSWTGGSDGRDRAARRARDRPARPVPAARSARRGGHPRWAGPDLGAAARATTTA